MERTIANMRFVLVEEPSGWMRWQVLIYINGDYWDHHSFDTEQEAMAFFNDPLAQDRAASQRKAQREAMLANDTTFLDPVAIRSIYRRSN